MKPSVAVLASLAVAGAAPAEFLPPDTPIWLRALLLMAAPSCVGLAWWAFAALLRMLQARYIGTARAKRALAERMMASPDKGDDILVPRLLQEAEISEETARAIGRQIDGLPKLPGP